MFLMAIDEDEYGVKPMNCPGPLLPVRDAQVLLPRSADPLRRLQPPAPLRAVRHAAGLTRVRSMAQDDAHIYCTPEQLDDELERFVAMTREVYGVFGFDRIEVTLQTRPEKFLGRIELWDAAEAALRRVARAAPAMRSRVLPGEGAFYGPKIGFDFRDVLERSWTLATVQIDCAMPERFGLKYVTPEGSDGDAGDAAPRRARLDRALHRHPDRAHRRATSRCGWRPVQVRVLTLTERQESYGREVTRSPHRTPGLRAELDDRNEKLGYKIREAQLAEGAVHAGGRRQGSGERHAWRRAAARRDARGRADRCVHCAN